MDELRVKEIINQRGISVPEFAKMLGVTREHCYAALRNQHASRKLINKMAQVLNLPVRALYCCPEEILSKNDPYEIVFGREEHYQPNDIITFGKLDAPWGEFSNMHTAFPVTCCGREFLTSEHLFIALRFSGYPELQEEIRKYPNSMWCKKVFVNSAKYKSFHHPHWHDGLFDVEVMKYVVALKYQQNEGFRRLLDKTKGKILVEDTSMQNSSNSVLRWGCQDLQKKDLIRKTRAAVSRFLRVQEKQMILRDEALKKPRTEPAQHLHDAKIKASNQAISKVCDIYERAILENCHYTLTGQNAMGKILTVLRDNNGYIDYNLQYPLFLFEEEIK